VQAVMARIPPDKGAAEVGEPDEPVAQ
jgi:hypothetical protein